MDLAQVPALLASVRDLVALPAELDLTGLSGRVSTRFSAAAALDPAAIARTLEVEAEISTTPVRTPVLPASIAGAFAAAAYSLQNSLQSTEMPEEDAGLLPQLYASRIGPRAQAYYLAQFKRFDALDRSLPSWNMAAAFFTLAWCCLRGLWLEAAK